ncbi:hypothetical protein [Pedobacter antarcticus]|uniref:hypothetical protein n=1 Tax=Pedobacter antarcticus TaxID=34086 RepID=UPI00292D0246|nr:hypothetical protein [Pedobacter antarcticus]
MDSAILANDSFFGTRLSVILENFPEGSSDAVEWREENSRLAEVTAEGILWPKAAGITYMRIGCLLMASQPITDK